MPPAWRQHAISKEQNCEPKGNCNRNIEASGCLDGPAWGERKRAKVEGRLCPEETRVRRAKRTCSGCESLCPTRPVGDFPLPHPLKACSEPCWGSMQLSGRIIGCCGLATDVCPGGLLGKMEGYLRSGCLCCYAHAFASRMVCEEIPRCSLCALPARRPLSGLLPRRCLICSRGLCRSRWSMQGRARCVRVSPGMV